MIVFIMIYPPFKRLFSPMPNRDHIRLDRILRRAVALAFCCGLLNPVGAEFVPSFGGTGVAADDASATLQEAADALKQGRVGDAEAVFLRLLEGDTYRAEAMLGMAATAQAKGREDAARKWMERALEFAPSNADLQRAQVQLFREQGNLTAEIELLQSDLEAEPGSEELRRRLAIILLRAQLPDEALPHFKQLFDAQPGDAQRRAEYGAVLIETGNRERGVEVLEVLPDRQIHDAGASGAFVAALLDFGRAKEAIAHLDYVFARGEQNAPLRYLHGDALIALNRPAAAVRAYQDAMAALPLPGGAVKLGYSLEELGRVEDAERSYRRALELDPEHAPAMNNLAVLLAERPGHRDEALKLSQAAVAMNGDIPAFLDTLGWVHHQRGESELARESYARALALDSDYAAARRHLTELDTMVSAAEQPTADVPPENTAASASVAERIPASPVAEVAALVPASTEHVESKVAGATEPEPDPAEQIGSLIESWRSAWAKKDVAAYLAMYGKGFRPPKAMSRAAWKRQREQRLSKPGRIEVQVHDVETSFAGDAAKSQFRQTYASYNYSDESLKTLEWMREQGRWRIISESSRPLR